MGDNLESAKNTQRPDLSPKKGWAKIRGEDITFKEHMKNTGKLSPGSLVGIALGPIVISVWKMTDIPNYVAGGVVLVLCAFATAALIKQRKKMKRAQAASTAPENA